MATAESYDKNLQAGAFHENLPTAFERLKERKDRR